MTKKVQWQCVFIRWILKRILKDVILLRVDRNALEQFLDNISLFQNNLISKEQIPKRSI